MNWLAEAYLWIKALHIMAVVAWMAGMLYLPRLYVYHAETPVGTPQSATFKVMERRLLRGIVNPSMVAVYLFGGLLLATPGVVDWAAGWIWVKLAAVAVLTVIHHMLSRARKAFEADRNRRSATYFRVLNEVPALLLVIIVVMVVVRPF